MLAALEVMVAVPVFVEATEIAFVKVPASPPLRVALDEPPVESPIVIVPVPKAVVLVVPETVPFLIVVPVV